MIEVWNKGRVTGGDIEGVLKWTERNFYDRGLFPAVDLGHGRSRARAQGDRVHDDRQQRRDGSHAIKAAVPSAQDVGVDGPRTRASPSINRRRERRRSTSRTSSPASTVEIIQDGKSLGKQAITGDSFSSTVKGSSGIRVREGVRRDKTSGPLPHHQRRAAQVARVRAHLAG